MPDGATMPDSAAAIIAPRSEAARTWRALLKNKTTLIGIGLALLVVLTAILAPVIAPKNPLQQEVAVRLTGPSAEHPFGTDFFGRDVLSRVIWGTRVSLVVGASSVGIAMVVGVILGMLAAVRRGRLESFILRAADVMMSFPDEVLGIMVIIALGTGMANLIIAIAILLTPRFIRLAYGPALAVMKREYLTASTALGAREARLMRKHLLPNIISEIVVMGALWVGTAIRLEANLSFLGLGVSPPTATWGNMIREGLNYITTAWWLSAIPGAAILLTILAFNLIGDGMRDMTDPKLTS